VVKALDFDSITHTFKSYLGSQTVARGGDNGRQLICEDVNNTEFASLAQLVEQPIRNQQVAGSNLTRSSIPVR
jgi:hypothetical protein